MTPEQERKLRMNVAVLSSECSRAHSQLGDAVRRAERTLGKATDVHAGDRFYDGVGHGALLDAAVAGLAYRREALRRGVELAEAFGLDVSDDIAMGGADDAARGIK